MQAMDQILKDNQFNFQLVATIPAILVFYGGSIGTWRLWTLATTPADRPSARVSFRMALRDIRYVLNAQSEVISDKVDPLRQFWEHTPFQPETISAPSKLAALGKILSVTELFRKSVASLNSIHSLSAVEMVSHDIFSPHISCSFGRSHQHTHVIFR